ncbi:MAG TPA: helix-turn-helix transcriptional regulator, partial [Longimicrobiales bacterium]|nr:helix-turn-helix transcriptional regulator [Longimicrobiales bacterium]
GRDVTVGSVYATLARLEDKGLLSSREGEPTPRRGGRARKHFRISSHGVRALRASRGMMERLWDGVELAAADRA